MLGYIHHAPSTSDHIAPDSSFLSRKYRCLYRYHILTRRIFLGILMLWTRQSLDRARGTLDWADGRGLCGGDTRPLIIHNPVRVG